MMFHLPTSSDETRNRRPDVAFITFDRWPADRALPYRGEPADVVPELVVEIASPNDKVEELLTKAYEFLEAGVRGVRLVWLVFPGLKVIHAYESVDALRPFKLKDELDGGTVLQSFRVPMSALFPPVTDFFVPDDE
jgi:Uma2 family endonuclease